ncbi:hypothetical protein [Geodermatophilus sp. CPCC 206100]|uniref:hypothetical protein n=1 Tax=Geodermatophilus sp. CPCC 206100 TaxID=3020054 RepID=UPI003B000047
MRPPVPFGVRGAENSGVDTALRPAVPPLPALVRHPENRTDAAQEFVTRMRAAAPDFAAAADAETAVVREVVPPARHRRSRCRVVLRFAGGTEDDVTFLGPVSRTSSSAERAFDLQIQTWLANGRGSEGDWLVPDDEAPGGVAVDVSAWSSVARTAG